MSVQGATYAPLRAPTRPGAAKGAHFPPPQAFVVRVASLWSLEGAFCPGYITSMCVCRAPPQLGLVPSYSEPLIPGNYPPSGTQPGGKQGNAQESGPDYRGKH